MSSLKKKSFRPNKEGSGVDLVLSCVDNYEARMAVNQVYKKQFQLKQITFLLFGFPWEFSCLTGFWKHCRPVMN